MLHIKPVSQESIMKQAKKTPMSTYEELMQNPEFKRKHEQSYRKLVLSELLLAIMAEYNILFVSAF